MLRSLGRELPTALLFFLCRLNGERFSTLATFKENLVIVIKYAFYRTCFLTHQVKLLPISHLIFKVS